MDSQSIQIIMQLLDSMDRAAALMEQAYNAKKADEFKKARDELTSIQKKISQFV
ncbi:MAG: hypothetical protein RL557_130 [archaeon]|jgi:hypothetical protein